MATDCSAIIITKNEAHQLEQCLKSVAFCREIIVVDSGSTDGTVELATQYGCTVVVTKDWPGFGAQKQRALDLASARWILSIDADEVVSRELRERIELIVSSNRADGARGYSVRRINLFLGQELRHGGWGDDDVVRFAMKASCRFTPDRVHEKLSVDGPIETISEPLVHDARASVQDVLEKQMRYVLLGLGSTARVGGVPRISLPLFSALITFLNYYIFRLGFLDGALGFFAAASRAQGKFWKKSGLSPISRVPRSPINTG